jgi:hypothetical protein
MAGLLVPAVILGQQDAPPPPPPPPILVYTADTPPQGAPAVLPEMAAQPLVPPGQGTEIPPATVITPAFPPAPTPAPAPAPTQPAPTPPAPAPPTEEPPPEVQPIATSTDAGPAKDTGSPGPALGPIRRVSYEESDGSAAAPAERWMLRESGLPFDPPSLGTPSAPAHPSGKAGAGGESHTPAPRPSNTGLVMEPERKPGGERSAEGAAGSASPGQGASLVLETTAPPRIVIGKPVVQRIVVKNIGSGDAVGVRVEETLPAGVRPLRSEPVAGVVGNRLTWDLGTVEAGGERKVQLELEAAEPMTLELSPTLHFLGVQTHIVQPELTLALEGPARVLRGEPVLFRLVARNNSPQTLYDVQLHYDVPEGLQHPGGKRIGLKLDALKPGQKRDIDLQVATVKAGKWVSHIEATGDNGIRAEVRHELQVAEPVLALRLDGPGHSLTEQEVIFRIEAVNPGPKPVARAHVALLMPPGVDPIATQPAAQYNALRRSLSWDLAALPVKEPAVILVKARAQKPGAWKLLARVDAEGRGPTHCGHTLQAEAPPPLAVEIQGGKEAIDTGEETVYEVHVLNLTRQTRSNLRLTARVTPTLTAVQASGPVHGTTEPQLVRFEVLRFLEPSQHARYQIRVRGQRPGPGGLHVEVSADGLGAPILKETRAVVANRGVRATGAGAAK